MKNLKTLALIFLAFSISFVINAQHIQLGNSPEITNRVPVNYVWPYTYTQTIYTAEEILFAGANPNGGQIQKIRYKPTESVNTQYWRNWEIYMGNTSTQSFIIPHDWIALEKLELVFDGYIANFTTVSEWLEIELDTEFTWISDSNLVIAVREKSMGFGNAPNWAAYTNTPEAGYRVIYGYQMEYIYNAEDPPPANGLNNIVAQIQLVGASFLSPCMPPVDVKVQAVTNNTISLNWEPPFFLPANGFDIYYSTNPAPADDYTTPNYTTMPGFNLNYTTISGLNNNETYYIWVRSNCGLYGFSDWRGPIKVTTPCYPYTIPYEEDFEFGFTHDQNIANCIVQESMAGNNYWKANNTYTSYNRSPRVGDWNACLQRSNSKWMFIPIELEANQEYLISFWARQDLNEGAKISVKYGLINSSEAMTNTIMENVEIYSGDYQEITESFTVPNSGMYFVGIYAEVFAGPWYLSIDDIIIDYLPTCWKPDNLQLEQVFTSGAKISWEDNVNQENNGYEIYASTSNQKPQATVTPIGYVSADTYEYHITNLNSNTTYYAWVRTNCSADDKSRWAGPIKFKTEYMVETSYLQEFNEGDILEPYTINSWIIGAERGATGNPANCIYVNLNENLQSDWFSTPYIAPITDGMVLRFEYKASNYNYPHSPTTANAGNLVVEVANEIENNFTQLISIDNNNDANYSTANIDLSAYVGQVIKFQFIGNRFSDNYDLSIDNIFIGDSIICEKPIELSATNITPNSARLTWNHYAENFDIEWGLADFEQGNGNFETSNTNYLDINELNENTKYEFYVRAWCYDIFEGEWAGPYSFTSDCYPYNIPYFEGFENEYIHDQIIASCLSQESIAGNASFLANNVYSNYNRTPRSGVWNAVLTYANTQYLFIPIHLEENELYNISLYARQDATFGANISIKYGIENNAEAMNNTILANQEITNGNYQKISANFSVPSDGVYYIGILAEVLYVPYYLSIDDISINIAPTCIGPENFNLSLIGDTWVKVKWDTPVELTPDSYDIYYNQSNIQPDATTIPNVNIAATNINYDIENLEASSNYYAWIRSNCGAGNYSDWLGPVSFSTNCMVQTLPIIEDFESAEIPQVPNCTNVQSVGSSGAWTTVESPNANFQTKTLKYQHNGSSANAWFYTRSFSLEAETNYSLRFKYGKNSEQAENIRVAFGNSTDQSSMISTIALLQNFDDEENIIVVNFSTSNSGIYYIGFNCFSNSADDGAVFIDDIHIDQAPICATPIQMTISNIGAYSASVSWPLNLAAYEIEWGPSMFEIGSGQRATVYDNHFQLNNLAFGTEHDVYLRQICASGEYSPWSVKRIFTTTCPTNALPLPYYEDFEGMFCYSIDDTDGDGFSWSMNVSDNHTENGYVAYMHDSFFQEQEGILISHLLQIPENRSAELSFWSRVDYANDYEENTVLISTDGFNFVADSIWSEQNPSEEWKKNTIDLLNYDDQEISIGFRYKGYFAHRWWIDDIAVELADDAKLSPNLLVYNLENPLNLSTNIIWNNAQSLVSLVDNQIEPYTLIQGLDYEVIDNSINILLPYLMQVLHSNDDEIEINLNFNNSSAILKIIATGFPVFVDANISPNNIEYDLSVQADINTTIEWNDASEILNIVDNQTNNYTLIENSDYIINGNVLTIFSSYLQTVLQHNGDILELSISFNHGFEVLTIEATGEILIFDASINPNYLEFNIENPQNLNTTIIWNSATEIIGITDNQGPNYNLQISNDYFINQNILTINESYLSSVLTQIGDIIILNIAFDYGTEQLSIKAIGEIPPIGASINPDSLLFNILNPENIFTNIAWNDASEITTIINTQNPDIQLVEHQDYLLNDSILSIVSNYITPFLQNINDEINLKIYFDHGEANLNIKATSGTFINTNALNLKVYPNPSKGKFIVEADQELIMQISDISGRKILEKSILHGQNLIDITNQAAGIYLINFVGLDFVKTLQIVIE